MNPMTASGPHGWLADAVAHAGHLLPAQAPLEVFVHHNTLHAFQHLPFHEAIALAGAKLGADGYLREEQYRAAYRAGRIVDADIDAAFAVWAPTSLPDLPQALPAARDVGKLVLLHDIGPETPAGLRWRMGEHAAASSFAPQVSSVARDRIRYETTAWLRRCVARSVESTMTLLVGPHRTNRQLRSAFEERFGFPPSQRGVLRLLERVSESVAVASLWEAARTCSRRVASAAPPSARRELGLPRDAVLRVGADDPNDLVHPTLITIAGAFLDRGLTHWSMPDRDRGFLVAFRRVLGVPHAVRPAWLQDLGRQLREWEAKDASSEDVVVELMEKIGVLPEERHAFIERTVLELPGWAGMFHRLEQAPPPVGRSAARVRLVDFLAVRLCLDALALEEVGKRLGHRGKLKDLRRTCAKLPRVAPAPPSGDHDRAWPLFLLAQHTGLSAPALLRMPPADVERVMTFLQRFDRRAHLSVWHEAYEHNYREQLLRALHVRRFETLALAAPRFQVMFCIDDRMESMRRHFEELDAAHRTFGVAGFFNLAIAYQGLDDPSTFPLCPVVLTPKHRVEEAPVSEHEGIASARRKRLIRMTHASNRFEKASRSLVWGSVVTAFAGFLAALPLLASVFMPRAAGKVRERVASWLLPAPKTRLATGGDPADREDGLADGFTVEEQAERVATLLENVGMVRDFAKIVALVGHTSSSVNNPHFAAYSCGACGGRSGGPNARLFAHMANRAEVRELLRTRAIDIPDTTVFIGGEHDTCADHVELFDVDMVPLAAMPELEALRAALDEACARNAHERCRRFESAPREPSPSGAMHHVEGRAFDLSQARPELGHATNASCVVGRRALTYGVFLDRRAFLVSYDPSHDPDAKILERTLLAVGPVCAGINLEYFFSTTDNERLGAGTKGPHNVTGLFGVMNGATSDLRTGLPRQMIEIHEPIRLQLVVESTPEIIEAIKARQPAVRELIDNEWVRLCLLDPESSTMWTFEARRGFMPWQPTNARLPRVGRSSDWYHAHGGFLPPALIEAYEPLPEELGGLV